MEKEDIYKVWKEAKNGLSAIINTQNYSFNDSDYIYFYKLYKSTTRQLLALGFDKDVLRDLAVPLGIELND